MMRLWKVVVSGRVERKGLHVRCVAVAHYGGGRCRACKSYRNKLAQEKKPKTPTNYRHYCCPHHHVNANLL